MDYFQQHPESGVTHPSQVCIVGDRLFTDMIMANTMGSWGLWVKDGVEYDKGIFARVEKSLHAFLHQRGRVAPRPTSPFED
jgi:phosphatidylglycerophosphatase GEP4